MTSEGENERKVFKTGDRTMVPHSAAIAKLLSDVTAKPAVTEIRPLPFPIQVQGVANAIQRKGWILSDYKIDGADAVMTFRTRGRKLDVTLDKAAFDTETPEQVAQHIIDREAGA